MNFLKKRLPANTQIIGFSRHPFSDDAFRGKMKEALLAYAPQCSARPVEEFARSCSIIRQRRETE